MLVVGNEELGAHVRKGDRVIDDTGLSGIVEYGRDRETGEETSLVGFITVEDGTSYLVAIKGLLFKEWRIQNEQS